MGEPVKIVDLAKQMIRLSGFRAMDENGIGDIEIQFTGLRPGEKLYEELLIDQNGAEHTDHQRVFKCFEQYQTLNEISDVFFKIIASSESNDINGALSILEKYVDGYRRAI